MYSEQQNKNDKVKAEKEQIYVYTQYKMFMYTENMQ